MRRAVRLSIFSSLLVLSTALCAAEPKPEVSWHAGTPGGAVTRGQAVKLKVTADIPAGWHIYSLTPNNEVQPTQIKLAPKSAAVLAGLVEADAKPVIVNDPAFSNPIEEHAGTVHFLVPVKFDPQTPPGAHELKLEISWQLCNDQVCLMPARISLPVAVKISDAPPAAEAAQPVSPPPNDAINQARREGLGAYLWLAFLAGLTALATPCVFPMIPITVSFFLKRKAATRQQAIRDAGVYSLGIIVMFTGIGFLFALLLGAAEITNFAANPWVNLAIAGIFVALALNLLGVYELQLPNAWLNSLNRSADKGKGLSAVLLMGLVFSLTSFTCTVPFVGAVMLAATQGDWLWPLMGMLVFSSVFAAPFFLLALFPSALQSLPRAGNWLHSVKVVMGLLEIAAALKFISNADRSWQWGVLTRNVFLSSWIVLAMLACLYLLGRIRLADGAHTGRLTGGRLLTATGFFSVSLFLATGLFGGSLGWLESFTPPELSKNGKRIVGGLLYFEDIDEAQALAKAKGQALFLDFSGDTCTNCRRMETGIFTRPEILARLKEFVRVQLILDSETEPEKGRSLRYQELQQKRYQTTARPFYAILSPDGRDIATSEGYTENAQAFEKFLAEGLAQASAQQIPAPPPGHAQIQEMTKGL